MSGMLRFPLCVYDIQRRAIRYVYRRYMFTSRRFLRRLLLFSFFLYALPSSLVTFLAPSPPPSFASSADYALSQRMRLSVFVAPYKIRRYYAFAMLASLTPLIQPSLPSLPAGREMHVD